MDRLFKCVKWSLEMEREALSSYFIHDEFIIRFIDGYHHDGKIRREPNNYEKGKELCKIIKKNLRENNIITSNQYKSERGKLKRGQYDTTLKFLENMEFYFGKCGIYRNISWSIKEFNDFCNTSIEEKDNRILYHIPDPLILGELEVKIECDGK